MDLSSPDCHRHCHSNVNTLQQRRFTKEYRNISTDAMLEVVNTLAIAVQEWGSWRCTVKLIYSPLPFYGVETWLYRVVYVFYSSTLRREPEPSA